MLTDSDYSEALDGESGERLLGYTMEPEQSETQYDKPRVDISDTQYNSHVVKEVKKIEQSTTKESDQPRSGVSDTEDALELGIDWDRSYQSRFVKWVFEEKKQRNYEKGMLRLHRKSLTREKEKLEKEKRDFSEAEADLARRIIQVKDLLPIADEFKQIGLDFHLANSWLSCVKEMSQRKGLDLRSAAWSIGDHRTFAI